MNESATQATAHADRKTYWVVALVLGILTLTEVAVFYVPLLHVAIVPILLSLSALKFALVAMFFMHLKYDSRVLTMIFSTGLTVAAVVILALILLFAALRFGL